MADVMVALKRPDRKCAARLSNYDRERAFFSVRPPERFNPVVDILDRWAADDPNALCVVSVDGNGELVGTRTAAELATATRETARALLSLGIVKGDRVFVMLRQVPSWHVAVLACIRIGAVPMPAPNMLTPRDIEYRIKQSGAVAAIVDASGAAKIDSTSCSLSVKLCTDEAPGWQDLDEHRLAAGDGDVPADPTHRDDPLILYFTSGTVSYPKMVEHPQSYALGHVGTARFWHDLRPGDLHWTVSDTGWAKAAWGTLFGQMHERAAIMQVDLGRPAAGTIFGIIERFGITSFCAPPTLYRMLVQSDMRPYDFTVLRHCTSAGEPLNPEVIRAWREGTGGLTVLEGYGQTETTCLVANFRSEPVRPGSMGRPVPGWDVTVVDDDGNALDPGEVGNVVVRYEPDRPIGLFSEYFGDPDATAEAFRRPFYFTGDKAAVDEDGFFWFEGRGDDIITSSAYRIGPFEVESAILEHAAVMEAAVVGRDDPERTQIVVAICVPAPGHEGSAELAAEIQEFVKKLTAPYKYPREVHFVDELPKTVSGKIRRAELRSWLSEGRLPRPSDDT
jgi:acetyl-CoA synthetase